MGEGKVELTREGHVAQLRFSNPPRHTLTAPMVQAMRAELDGLVGDRETRVLVLRSATPGIFITHYEVGELSDIAEANRPEAKPTEAARPEAKPAEAARPEAKPAEAARPEAKPAEAGASESRAGGKLHELHELILALESLDAVTIAALDGLAMGGGLELALGCDFRVMRDGPHVVGLPETGVGILPGAGGTQRLARLLGTARALDLVLHGELLSPARALELGLLSRVYPDADFDAQLAAFVANLESRAPIALVQAKRAIREGVELPLRDGLLLEQEAFGRTMASEDARGAMKAYLKGERYTFKGE